MRLVSPVNTAPGGISIVVVTDSGSASVASRNCTGEVSWRRKSSRHSVGCRVHVRVDVRDQDRLGRAPLGGVECVVEFALGGRHQGGVERAAHRERRCSTPPEVAVVLHQIVESRARAAHDDLAGAVDVGDPDIVEGFERVARTLVATHHGDHRSLFEFGRSGHGRAAHGDEACAFFDAQQPRGDEGRELPEAVAHEIARANAEVEQFVIADEREGEGGELGAVGAHDLIVACARAAATRHQRQRPRSLDRRCPVGRVAPRRRRRRRERALARKERDHVVAKREVMRLTWSPR